MYKNQSSDIKALGLVLWQIAFTAAALYISVTGAGIIWFLGQLLLGISLFQWFVIHHDMAHESLFRTRILNKIVGHLSSIPALLPYHSFKLGHNQHHYWTGWKDKDPSNPQTYLKEPPAWAVKAFNFCWRYWVPLLSPVFVAQNFWNVGRLFSKFDHRKDRIGIVFSIALVTSVYIGLFMWSATFMVHYWLLPLVVFLSISDLVLMSQHSHLDWHEAGEDDVEAFRYEDQSKYTRSIVYPKFLSRFLFYNFDRHGLHHQHPHIPTYQLGTLPPSPHLNVDWWEWLKKAKSLSAYSLIYSTPEETGERL